ncbi:MAG TPA: SURF1 family protein [Acetobacteraceae bacterium]|nr:SURF1 family protein [Acetobacteraceae bacterium]
MPEQSAPPRRKWRRLIGPGIASFIGFWLLIALGVWQLHRYHYKQGILDAIARAQLAPPVPLPAHPSHYEKVAVAGRWMAGIAAFYGDQIRNSPHGQVQGGQLIMPLKRPDGRVMLVDLGWVEGRSPKPFPVPDGLVQVSGFLEPPNRPGLFSARDNPARRVFYTLDPRAIGRALGLSGVEDFTLMMLGPRPVAGGPIPAAALPHPPNNSLQYALTWFGLAMVLIFEFVFFARKRLIEE